MNTPLQTRMDRRTAIKWMLAAAASPMLQAEVGQKQKKCSIKTSTQWQVNKKDESFMGTIWIGQRKGR